MIHTEQTRRSLGPDFPAHDIVIAANDMEEYSAGLTYETFTADNMIQAASQRLLGIIADNAVRLGVRDTCDWADIADMIYHRFEDLTPEATWRLIQIDVPRLKALAQTHLV